MFCYFQWGCTQANLHTRMYCSQWLRVGYSPSTMKCSNCCHVASVIRTDTLFRWKVFPRYFPSLIAEINKGPKDNNSLLTWKRKMMVQISPSVRRGFPSTISCAPMFSRCTRCSLRNINDLSTFSRQWIRILPFVGRGWNDKRFQAEWKLSLVLFCYERLQFQVPSERCQVVPAVKWEGNNAKQVSSRPKQQVVSWTSYVCVARSKFFLFFFFFIRDGCTCAHEASAFFKV